MSEEPSNRPPGKNPLPSPIRFGRPTIGWVFFALLLVLLLTLVMRGMDQRSELRPDDFWTYLENGQIKSMIIMPEHIEGELTPNIPGRKAKETSKFTMPYNFQADQTFVERVNAAIDKAVKQGAQRKTEYSFAPAPGIFQQIIPYVLLYGGLILLIWFLLFRKLGQGAGGAGFLGNFGRSKHRVLTKEHTNITFKDVAGIEEAKTEVSEIIEFLKNPRRFARIGARIPRGVLLVGEPGCGKTLLAKAIAGEADVPFLSISGSDFVEMFVGVGASRVRDLFRQAKDSAPCIIFLDEIDAVGRRRGMGFNGGGHDEREQTLNAILVEMDGFDTSDNVIVIAATNRMDVLDPALTRPGRFDRQVQVPLPDIKGRYDILKIYVARIKVGPDVDLQRIARGTPMFSGADLAAMINEAAIAATMANKEYVDQSDLEEARDKVRWGRARRSRVIDEREKEMTAYHEAGHALVQIMTPEADPLHKVSIIPRGPMGGGTFSLPETDRYLYTRKWCEAYIRIAVAGRISEEMFCGDIDSGAAADIAQSTEVARKMIMDWGMSDKLGFVRYAPDPQKPMMLDAGKEYSDKTAESIDQEIKAIMDEACGRTRQLLDANRTQLKALAEALLKYETIDAADVRRILGGESIDKPSMNDLIEQERNKAAAPGSTDSVPPIQGSSETSIGPKS